MSIEFHRAAIAFHQAEIDKLSGIPVASGFDPADWRTWWPSMLAQFADESKPHPWRDFGKDTPLPELAGNNAPMPRCYDTHRGLWEAAQRGDPIRDGGPNIKTAGVAGWPGPDGKAFRITDYQRKGTEAVYDAIAWLDSESPHGLAWKASPAIAPTYPKDSPAMNPVSR